MNYIEYQSECYTPEVTSITSCTLIHADIYQTNSCLLHYILEQLFPRREVQTLVNRYAGEKRAKFQAFV